MPKSSRIHTERAPNPSNHARGRQAWPFRYPPGNVIAEEGDMPKALLKNAAKHQRELQAAGSTSCLNWLLR